MSILLSSATIVGRVGRVGKCVASKVSSDAQTR